MTAPGKVLAACIACMMLLAGCRDKLSLEDATVPLALGLEVEDDKFHSYISAPVFSRDIQKKSREAGAAAQSLRQTRSRHDAQFPGAVQGRNFQVVLLGKQMLQYDD